LAKEIDFFLIKAEVNDAEIFGFLKRLQKALRDYKKVRLNY
jgi:hypothetical protein